MILHRYGHLDKPNKDIKNIVLTGICGSGKSTVGRQLARRLGFGFLDIDEWIEKSEKKSISQIFSDHGEAYFREQELAVFSEIKSIRNHVIAAGGGGVSSRDSWNLVKSIGYTIWLKIDPGVIAKRLVKNEVELKKRPLLSDILGVEEDEEREQVLRHRLESQLKTRIECLELAAFCYVDSFATFDEAANRLKQVITKSQPGRRVGQVEESAR